MCAPSKANTALVESTEAAMHTCVAVAGGASRFHYKPSRACVNTFPAFLFPGDFGLILERSIPQESDLFKQKSARKLWKGCGFS